MTLKMLVSRLVSESKNEEGTYLMPSRFLYWSSSEWEGGSVTAAAVYYVLFFMQIDPS